MSFKNSVIIFLSIIALSSLQAIPLREWLQHNEPVITNGELNLNDQGLTDIEGIDEIPGIDLVFSLYLSDNYLKSIPDTIGRLTQLQNIDFSRNHFTSIPHALCQLTQLRSLRLSENHLKSIPDAIGQITQLGALFLYDNQLTSIPDAIGQLTRLQQLFLCDNQLTSIPNAMDQLVQLQTLGLTNNPISGTTAAIKQAYFNSPAFNHLHLSFKTPKVELYERRLIKAITAGFRLATKDNAKKICLEDWQNWRLRNLRTEQGNMPLHFAAQYAEADCEIDEMENYKHTIFKTLLALSDDGFTDLSARNKNGMTPLMLAATYNHRIIYMLLKYFGNPE